MTTETPSSTAPVLAEVAAERGRQETKWGQQDHPDGTGPNTTPMAEIVRGPANAIVNRHYAFGLAYQAKSATDAHAKDGTITYADIFLEEVFEALAEDDPAKLRAELIQCAAVAVAWAEKIDRDQAAEPATKTKCHSCDGEGRTDSHADASERAPWSFWENLPPGQDIAVRRGWVKPMDCVECGGSGAL